MTKYAAHCISVLLHTARRISHWMTSHLDELSGSNQKVSLYTALCLHAFVYTIDTIDSYWQVLEALIEVCCNIVYCCCWCSCCFSMRICIFIFKFTCMLAFHLYELHILNILSRFACLQLPPWQRHSVNGWLHLCCTQ